MQMPNRHQLHLHHTALTETSTHQEETSRLWESNNRITHTHTRRSYGTQYISGTLLSIHTVMSNNQGQPQNPNIRPPQFVAANIPGMSTGAAAAVQTRGTPATLNLDDIFGDCFFTPEGEAVFLSENPQLQQQIQQQQQLQQQMQQSNQQQFSQRGILTSGEAVPTQGASRYTNAGFTPVPQAGGITTTGLHKTNGPVTVMGNVNQQQQQLPSQVPFAQAPQRPHHLQYAYVQAGGHGQPPPQAALGSAKRATTSKDKSADRT